MTDSSSGSDFDDDEDPDNIEIPRILLNQKFLNSDLPLFSSIDKPSPSLLAKNLTAQVPARPLPPKFPTLLNSTPSIKPIQRVDNDVSLETDLDVNQIQSNYLSNLTDTLPEEEEAYDEEMIVAETYADYMPRKLKVGKRHPDPVVESASLSSVEPADVWYNLSIPEESIKSGILSALQLESITYASQQHEHFLPDGSRAGFLIGDGAGVGKGRTIAGIIYENYLKDRKRAIWISVSNDLKYDAERDLRDIGARKIEVHALNKFRYTKISATENGGVKKGVVFSTYSALIGESTQTGAKYKSRLDQLIAWCGQDFDGVIVFDECHRAKNLYPSGSSKPTKTGLAVVDLQRRLPKARVVYASATGASEPRNMAYMIRLGMWGRGTPFPDFVDFISAVEKRGVGGMEIVAMDMKLRGMYIARQLSFHGVTFRIEEVPLTQEFTKVYNLSVKLWVEAMNKFKEAASLIDAENRMKKTMWGQFWSSHQRFFKYLCIAAKVKHTVTTTHEAVKCGKCVVIGLQSTGEARTLDQLERDDGELSDFVSTAKGVFLSLVEKHFPAPDRDRINRVLGLELPGANRFVESILASKRKREEEVKPSAPVKKPNVLETSFDSDSEESEEQLSMSGGSEQSDYNPFGDSDSNSDVDPWERKGKKAKAKVKKKKAKKKKPESVLGKKEEEDFFKLQNLPPPVDSSSVVEQAIRLKEELIQKIEKLGELLPPNTLDQLIDELGGTENVAEMTGRKGRVVQTDDGIQYESRSEMDIPLETLNITEKQRFMNGEKTVAIISEAASSGISLQSDRRVRNQMRRVHVTLELPWSADRAIQQFGRTHRSNQVNAPEYVFLISELAGERRFASTVAKRLESLGALTHGDRRATETRDLSQFNIDNKYGRSALEATMKAIVGYELPIVPPPTDYPRNFFRDVAEALVGVGLINYAGETPDTGFVLDKDYNNMSKFLNRILGMPVDLQNRLFKYFTDTLNAVVLEARKSGHFDMGILDLSALEHHVRRTKLWRFFRKHATGISALELHTVNVERGMDWEKAEEMWCQLSSPEEGFYLSHRYPSGQKTLILVVAIEVTKMNQKSKSYDLYRPNTGFQRRQENIVQLQKRYTKISAEEAEAHWVRQYNASANSCLHRYLYHNCKNQTIAGMDCEVGLRHKSYNILSGSVLAVWARVEGIFTNSYGHSSKMQVVRLRTDDDIKIVGIMIPKLCTKMLHESLASDAERVEEKTF